MIDHFCSDFKFKRQSEVGWFSKIWNHWMNPLGNWHEPKPWPMKRQDQFVESFWSTVAHEDVWWTLRNPFHNFTHFWIGITPRGERYEWIHPQCDGWRRTLEGVSEGDLEDGATEWELYAYRKPGKMVRYQFKFWFRLAGTEWNGYIGWMDRGNFGMAFRK